MPQIYYRLLPSGKGSPQSNVISMCLFRPHIQHAEVLLSTFIVLGAQIY